MSNQNDLTEPPQVNTPKPASELFNRKREELLAKLSSPEADAEDERRLAAEARRFEADKLAEVRTRVSNFVEIVGSRYRDCSLKTFTVYDERQKSILREVEAFAVDLPAQIKIGRNALFFGPPGTGKDHLLVSLLKEAAVQGASVHWINGAALFTQIRDSIADDKPERELTKRLVEPMVLGISDPQRVDPREPERAALTTHQATKFLEIIDARYRNCRPTWVTMNVASHAEANQRLGAALVDRLRGGALICCCNWPSHRTLPTK